MKTGDEQKLHFISDEQLIIYKTSSGLYQYLEIPLNEKNAHLLRNFLMENRYKNIDVRINKVEVGNFEIPSSNWHFLKIPIQGLNDTAAKELVDTISNKDIIIVPDLDIHEINAASDDEIVEEMLNHF